MVGLAIAAVHPSRGPKGPVSRGVSARPAQEIRVHDVGNFWFAFSNFGQYGDPNDNFPSGEWPAGSGVWYIWEGRFWIGAEVGGEKYVSHCDYSAGFEWEASDGSSFYLGTGPKAIQDGLVYFDDLAELSGHTPLGLRIAQHSLAWSLPDYDDFIVFLYEIKNVSGGPLNGVYVSYVFDNDVGRGPGGDASSPHIDDLVDYDGWTPQGNNPWEYDVVDPLDLDEDEITGYDYWGVPIADSKNPYNQDPAYDDDHNPGHMDPEPDGFYDEYQIYLDPNGPPILYQTGSDAGQPATYADGTPLTGWLISRDMSYMYDGDYTQSSENDTGERLLPVPVSGFIGTRLIYLPISKEEWNTTFSTGAEADTMPRPWSHQWWNWNSDPGTDQEMYEYMEASHIASEGQHFLVHPFDYGAGAPVFDYRYMLSTGPFDNWADGETKKVVMVTGVGWGLQGLREIVDNAYVAYFKGEPNEIGFPDPEAEYSDATGTYIGPQPDQLGFYGASNTAIINDGHFQLPIPPAIPDLHYSAGDKSISMVWDDIAERTVDSFLGTTDFEGYKVYRSIYDTQSWEILAAFDNVDGTVYLRNAEGDTILPITDGTETFHIYSDGYDAALAALDSGDVRYEWVPVDLPAIKHNYSDTGADFYADDAGGVSVLLFGNIDVPVNGLPYYYAVTAYDPDKPAIGLFSIESATANYRKLISGASEAVYPRPEAAAEEELDRVQVVPNPYKGTATWEVIFEDRIDFINLPPRCKITIFSLTGDMIDEIYHQDATSGTEQWNLVSRNNQKIVSGLYIYCVETPGGEKKIGKFVIIR